MAGKGTRGAMEKSELISTLTKLLEDKIEPIDTKLKKLDIIETSVGYALEEIKKLTDLEIHVKQLENDLIKTSEELRDVKTENKLLKDKLLKQESFTRRNNIKIWGIAVANNEDIERKVLENMCDIGIKLESRDIERIHFVGPAGNKQPRPILMKLLNFKDKMIIMKKKKDLKQKNIVVVDDYPQEVLERRQLIVPTFFKALKVCPELQPKLRVDSMILGGKEYTVDHITTIPVQDLQPKRMFTPQQNGITAFYTKYSPLSNHFPATFRHDGHLFYSSEQCYMYLKAAQFKDSESSQQILQSVSPIEAKKIGKRIQNFNSRVWREKEEECMYTAMYAKFSQNKDLLTFLTNTKGTKLAEASPFDVHWGIGIPLRNDNIFHVEKWRGKNMSGKTLSRVRQTLC